MAYQNHPVFARRIDPHLATEGMDGVREACERRRLSPGWYELTMAGD